MRTTSLEWLDQNALAVLEPLHRKPGDPTLAAAAAWLFHDSQSPWRRPIGRKGSQSTYHITELIASPLVEVPAFREMLLAALEDRSPLGKAESAGDGMVSVRLDDDFSMGGTAPRDDRDHPPQGTTELLRVCDFYAWRLATLESAPAFNPCWPLARRDETLAALAIFLKTRAPK